MNQEMLIQNVEQESQNQTRSKFMRENSLAGVSCLKYERGSIIGAVQTTRCAPFQGSVRQIVL